MEQAVGTKSKKTLIIIFEAVMVLTLLILGVFTIALNPTKLRIGYGVMIFLFVIGEGVHFATRVYSFYGKDPEKVHRIRGFGDLFISVVMTVGFLVFLFLNYYFFLPENAFFFMTGCLAASVRIIACCFPDNHWLSGPLPTTGVRRFRNIPMVLLMLLRLHQYHDCGLQRFDLAGARGLVLPAATRSPSWVMVPRLSLDRATPNFTAEWASFPSRFWP
jgi:hypothetical protein